MPKANKLIILSCGNDNNENYVNYINKTNRYLAGKILFFFAMDVVPLIFDPVCLKAVLTAVRIVVVGFTRGPL